LSGDRPPLTHLLTPQLYSASSISLIFSANLSCWKAEDQITGESHLLFYAVPPPIDSTGGCEIPVVLKQGYVVILRRRTGKATRGGIAGEDGKQCVENAGIKSNTSEN
jgi:hypothetical protein